MSLNRFLHFGKPDAEFKLHHANRPDAPPTLDVLDNAGAEGMGAYHPITPVVHAKDVPGSSQAADIPGKQVRTYRMAVLSNPKPGREEDYARWYDEVHIADVLQIPGFRMAQRFAAPEPANGLPKYAVYYEIESADIDASHQEIPARIQAGTMKMSDAFDGASAIVCFYERRD